jgi:hypothetical protein
MSNALKSGMAGNPIHAFFLQSMSPVLPSPFTPNGLIFYYLLEWTIDPGSF